MARGSQSGRKNNNPEGRNQYSGGLMERVRNHPIASAAAAGGAVAAGMFLWSKRDKIGDQMSTMSDKVGQWNEGRKSQSSSDSGTGSSATSMRSGKRANETGSERIGSGAIAGASAASSSGSGRSTGGRSGSAQSGQNMNPSRTASETVSY